MTEEIFSIPNYIHIKGLIYDYNSNDVDYHKGTEHLVDGTHYVLATDEEFAEWTK